MPDGEFALHRQAFRLSLHGKYVTVLGTNVS